MKSSSVSCVSITVAFSPSLALLWTISTEFFFFCGQTLSLCSGGGFCGSNSTKDHCLYFHSWRRYFCVSLLLLFYLFFFSSLSFAFSERQPRVLWPALSWPSGGLHFVVIFIEHATILHHSSTRWQHCLVLSWLQQHEHFNVRIPYGINIINNFGLFWVYWDHLDGIIKIIIKSQMSLQAAMALVQTLTVKEKFS